MLLSRGHLQLRRQLFCLLPILELVARLRDLMTLLETQATCTFSRLT